MNLLRMIKRGGKKLFLYFFTERYVKRYIERTQLRDTIWGGGIFIDEINKAFDIFLTKKEKDNIFIKEKYIKDIVASYLIYGSTPQEYFLLKFPKLSKAERKRFVVNKYKDLVLIKKIGLDVYYKDLRDKYNFYLLTAKYFKRDVIKVGNISDFDEFKNFTYKHDAFIVKPLKGMCGVGTEIFKIGRDGTVYSIFEKLIATKDVFIIEELIIQGKELGIFNQSSVNTIRYPSFRTSNGFEALGMVLRVGRAGMIVDNAAMGGLIAAISSSGEVYTDAVDEFGNEYKEHPDSKMVFKGYKVPAWDKLVDFAIEIHDSLPDIHKYVAFDFAYSEKYGWVLIEANWGQFLSEFASKEGIKEKFNRLMKV